MNANLPSEETIEMYRRISKQLTAPYLLSRLGKHFDGRPSLPQLLAWVHAKVKFNKGNIIHHNDPFEIVDYGQGKCREFSLLFTAVCLATGYRARIILDMSDHVWTEIWDTKKNKWIHVDPSEKKIDDPEMYERDWKKNLTEVYALENGRIENVTKSYKITEQC